MVSPNRDIVNLLYLNGATQNGLSMPTSGDYDAEANADNLEQLESWMTDHKLSDFLMCANEMGIANLWVPSLTQLGKDNPDLLATRLEEAGVYDKAIKSIVQATQCKLEEAEMIAYDRQIEAMASGISTEGATKLALQGWMATVKKANNPTTAKMLRAGVRVALEKEIIKAQPDLSEL
jgi:hypothetical protein